MQQAFGSVINKEQRPEVVSRTAFSDAQRCALAGVNGTPTVHCFKDKERVENISGVKMKSEWRKIFGKYAGEKVAA
jgi:hypothetical protein